MSIPASPAEFTGFYTNPDVSATKSPPMLLSIKPCSALLASAALKLFLSQANSLCKSFLI